MIWFMQVFARKLESRRTPAPIVNRTGDCYVIQSIKAIRLERLAHDHLSNPTAVHNAKSDWSLQTVTYVHLYKATGSNILTPAIILGFSNFVYLTDRAINHSQECLSCSIKTHKIIDEF